MPKVARRPDSKYWFAWVTNARTGKRERISTHETNKRIAQSVADALELQARDPSRIPAEQVRLAAAVTEFIEQRASLKAAATKEFYEKKTNVLLEAFGPDTPIDRIDAKALDRYCAGRLSEGVKKSTIGKERTALRQVLKLQRRHGKYPHALDQVFDTWEGQSKAKERWVSEVEAWQIIFELPEHRGAAVAFHVATGSNLGECLRARREDIAPDLSQVFLRGTKRATRRRTVPVFAWGTPFLRYALNWGRPEGLLFEDWYKAMRWDLKRVCDRLGLEGVSSNDLRRTYGKWLDNRGVSSKLIGSVLGHAPGSKVTDRHYVQKTVREVRMLIDMQLEGVK